MTKVMDTHNLSLPNYFTHFSIIYALLRLFMSIHLLMSLCLYGGNICMSLSISPYFDIQWYHVASLILAMIRLFTPPKLAEAPNQGFFNGKGSVFGELDVKHLPLHHCRHICLKYWFHCDFGKMTQYFWTLVFYFLRLLWGLRKLDWIKAVVPTPGCTSE